MLDLSIKRLKRRWSRCIVTEKSSYRTVLYMIYKKKNSSWTESNKITHKAAYNVIFTATPRPQVAFSRPKGAKCNWFERVYTPKLNF